MKIENWHTQEIRSRGLITAAQVSKKLFKGAVTGEQVERMFRSKITYRGKDYFDSNITDLLKAIGAFVNAIGVNDAIKDPIFAEMLIDAVYRKRFVKELAKEYNLI